MRLGGLVRERVVEERKYDKGGRLERVWKKRPENELIVVWYLNTGSPRGTN